MRAYNYLLAHGIKPSQQRIALMAFLMENRIHPTADEVYTRLSPEMPTLSKTTVYNTLKLFVEKGAAQMLTIDERNVCFDVDTTAHAHFLCKECGTITDLHEPSPTWNKIPELLHDCRVDEVNLYLRGTCRRCMAKHKKSEILEM